MKRYRVSVGFLTLAHNKTIGEGDNAYYRLIVEGSNQGTFSTKKDAIEAKKTYIASLQSRKKRVIPRQ